MPDPGRRAGGDCGSLSVIGRRAVIKLGGQARK
jgi:hypothetical protein